MFSKSFAKNTNTLNINKVNKMYKRLEMVSHRENANQASPDKADSLGSEMGALIDTTLLENVRY